MASPREDSLEAEGPRHKRRIPISYDRQLTLFKHDWRKLELEHHCSKTQALILFRHDLLSFDPEDRKRLEDYEKEELLFLKALYFDSGLPEEIVFSMLDLLDKPYYYSFADIFWDFGCSGWKRISDIASDYLKLRAKDFIVEHLQDGLDDCNADELFHLHDIVSEVIEAWIDQAVKT